MSKLTLNGYVVGNDDQWLYDYLGVAAFSPSTVRTAIENTPEGEPLEVEINSGGGSVFAGFEIYSLLYSAPCDTVAIVQSLAGSAASTIMAGCKRVLMSPVAQVMIHLPSSCAEGNQDVMTQEAKVLESITQSIINGYLSRCGAKCDRKELERLMRAESWLTAQEAVALGLADGILGEENGDSGVSPTIINSVGSGIRALFSNNLDPLPTRKLMERYEQLVRSGAKPCPGHPVPMKEKENGEQEKHDNWREEARLNIERNRFYNIKED